MTFLENDSNVKYFKIIEEYKSKLEKSGLPVIYSIKHFAEILGVKYNQVSVLCVGGRRKFYTEFRLKKKKSGYRYINSPCELLKEIQNIILREILYKVQTHPASNGFEIGKSIIDNAKIHLSQNTILKMDLHKFYDSINEKRVFGLFRSLGYHSNLSVSFAKLCTMVPSDFFIKSLKGNDPVKEKINRESYQGILPQGAPTSPQISNLICRNLDNELHNLAENHTLKYSRYADDLTFSGVKETLELIKPMIISIIVKNNFFINHAKTKILVRGNKYCVTGLNVTNECVKVPKKLKKEIEHHLYYCKRFGVKSHLAKNQLRKLNYKDWLEGKISFVYSVEKDLGIEYFKQYNAINWPV